MGRLGSDPAVARLAHALGLSTNGDCAARLREHALARVRAIAADWRVASLRELQMLVANSLSVCLEYLHSDGDVAATARAHAAFSPHLTHALNAEFLTGDTEGLLIPHPYPQPGDLRYLAVVDQRGSRLVRGYFTAWHELAHLLVSPPQLVFEGFRRSPPLEVRHKDQSNPSSTTLRESSASMTLFRTRCRGGGVSDRWALDAERYQRPRLAVPEAAITRRPWPPFAFRPT
jgi:hypothetical protein